MKRHRKHITFEAIERAEQARLEQVADSPTPSAEEIEQHTNVENYDAVLVEDVARHTKGTELGL